MRGGSTTRRAERGAARLVAAIAVAVVAGGLKGPPPAAASELLVVVNPANSVAELTVYEVARIFRGEIVQWPDGRRIQVIDYKPERPERAAFYRAVFHSGPERHAPRGSPYVFRPLEQADPALVKRLVAVMPNAIAYLPARAGPGALKVVARIEVGP